MTPRKAKPRTPKLGSRSGSAVWYSGGHWVSEDAQGSLVALCGLTDEQESAKMLRAVSLTLGIFSGPAAEQALDNEPRPSEYAKAFKRIESCAAALNSELKSLHSRIRDQLDSELMAPDAPLVESQDQPTATESLQVRLETLTTATQELSALYRNETSRGRPKKNARDLLDSSLREVFSRYYRGSETSLRSRGAVTIRSERHKREDEFVKFALAEHSPLALR